MPTRVRTRVLNQIGTFVLRAGQPQTISTLPIIQDRCEDWTGNPGGDNPFHSERRFCSGSVINTSVPATSTTPFFDSCQSNAFHANTPTPVMLTVPAASTEVNRALAVTNPNRPDILLPAFIAELRDLPKVLKYSVELGKFLTDPSFRRDIVGSHRFKSDYLDAGRLVTYLKPTPGNALSAAKQLGSANLAMQFGILPLFQDIAKMAMLMESVEGRRKEFNRMFSGNGLRREVQLFSNEYQASSPNSLVETRYTMGSAMTARRTVRRWASVRWKPAAPSTLPPSDATIRQSLLGMNIHSVASVAWELLPWSWLADYFGNVGHTLSALNNAVGTAPPRGCVMTLFTENMTHAGGYYGPGQKYHLSSGNRKVTVKTRYPFTGQNLPSFGLPILGGRQLSILGSIYATRALR